MGPGPAHSAGNCYISAGERFLCLILPMTDASFSCAITSVTRFIITAHSVIKLIVSTDVLSELHLKTLHWNITRVFLRQLCTDTECSVHSDGGYNPFECL